MTATNKKDAAVEESKDIAVKKENPVAVAHDYGDMAGAGFEGTKATDLSIPFLHVLQSSSELVEDGNADPGQIINTVTGEIIEGDAGIVFLPCYKERMFVEWEPDAAGFVGTHDPESEIVKKAIADNDGQVFGDLKVGKNDLVETHYVYGLILNADGTESESFAVVAFASTKIKPCRDWFTAMYTIKGQPPLFANRAVLKTVKQKKGKNTYFNIKIEPLKDKWTTSLIDPKTEGQLLEEAKEFKKMVTSGLAKAAFDTQQDNSDSKADGEKAPF